MNSPHEPVQLDLNNPVFQRQWFALPKQHSNKQEDKDDLLKLMQEKGIAGSIAGYTISADPND